MIRKSGGCAPEKLQQGGIDPLSKRCRPSRPAPDAKEKPVLSSGNIVVLSGLVIGLLYGAVGLLSGFCMMSSLRGWWAEGDSRLVRTYALAIALAIAATQLLATRGLVDLGKSIYLQPSFSAPLMFFGGLLFGYGMVLSNGCGSRALVLLGRGQLGFVRGGGGVR